MCFPFFSFGASPTLCWPPLRTMFKFPTQGLVAVGADGACFGLRDLGSGEAARAAAKQALAVLGDRPTAAPAAPPPPPEAKAAPVASPEAAAVSTGKRLLSAAVQSLIAEQKGTLERTVRVLEEVAPDLAEARSCALAPISHAGIPRNHFLRSCIRPLIITVAVVFERLASSCCTATQITWHRNHFPTPLVASSSTRR